MLDVSFPKGLDNRRCEQQEAGGNQRPGEGRKFQPFQSLTIAGKDRYRARKDPGIPENGSQVMKPTELQWCPAQPGSEPDNHTGSCKRRPTVHDRVEMRGPNSPECPQSASAEPVREVEFQRSHDPEERSNQKPGYCRDKVKHGGCSRRVVDGNAEFLVSARCRSILVMEFLVGNRNVAFLTTRHGPCRWISSLGSVSFLSLPDQLVEFPLRPFGIVVSIAEWKIAL